MIDFVYLMVGIGIIGFSLIFIWSGKRIAEDKEQLIEWKGFKLKANGIIFIFFFGVFFMVISKPFAQTGEEKCNSLVGDYTFHRDARYVFTSDEFTNREGVRATAVSGSWDGVHCNKGGMGEYYLVGTDTSTHAIEIRTSEGQFKPIGTVTARYTSQVLINKDGSFGARRVIEELGTPIEKYDHPDYGKSIKKKSKNMILIAEIYIYPLMVKVKDILV